MKRIITIIFTTLMSICAQEAFAYDIAVKNADSVTIYYNYYNDAKELQVVGAEDGVSTLVIPDEVVYMNRKRDVTSIGNGAFYNHKSLTSVTIGNSVTNIGRSAFSSCSGLTSVTIPNSVTNIGSGAFYGCTGLERVNISDITSWCKINFDEVYEGTSNPLYYARHLYMDGSEVTELTIPNSVTNIGSYAFAGCSGLTSVIIPNSVTSIGFRAFYNCSGLTSVIIPNSVTNIEGEAFYGCIGLTSVTIPNSVTKIGGSAFYGCIGLTSVTIPNSVTKIGGSAFSSINLTKVVSLIETPYIIEGKTSSYSTTTFSLHTFNNATLYVPIGTIEKYKSTSGWKDFLFIEEGDGSEDNPEVKKCSKPTISYNEGKLAFNCDTEGVEYQYNISDSDIKSGLAQEVQLGVTYNISVWATKFGYENSDEATATLCWIDVEPQTEGIINSVGQIKANPVLIQSQNGQVSVSGTEEGTQISIYGINGQLAGTAKAVSGNARIDTKLSIGSIAIVKIGEKSVKIVIQ